MCGFDGFIFVVCSDFEQNWFHLSSSTAHFKAHILSILRGKTLQKIAYQIDIFLKNFLEHRIVIHEELYI